MKKKINDALLTNLGHGVIDQMDEVKDGDQMKALRRKLKEVIVGKKRTVRPGIQKKVRIGEASGYDDETEMSLASGSGSDSGTELTINLG